MKITIAFIFIIYFSAFGFSQQIKSIKESYTYFENDSAVYSWAKTVHEWEYDKKGRLLKDHDREGVCFVDWTYDKKGRLVKEESHCGEGYSICETIYNKSTKYQSCETNYHKSITIDSFDKEKRIASSKNSFNYNEQNEWQDTIAVVSYHTFQYDDKANLIKEEFLNEEKKIQQAVRYFYDSKNRKIAQVIYNDNGESEDSIAFLFDDKNRITAVQKYDLRIYNVSVFKEFEMNVSYSELMPGKNTLQLNDTITKMFLPYSIYETNVSHAPMPMRITYKHFTYHDDPFYNADLEYYYSYDSLGRITAISGNGTGIRENKEQRQAEIAYYENDEAVLNIFGQTYLDELITAQSHYFQNGRLKHIIEYSEGGFPYTVRKFEYTFFK